MTEKENEQIIKTLLNKPDMDYYYRHDELCDFGVQFLSDHIGCPIIAKECKSFAQEIPDVIGFRSVGSFLIECKTSHDDFIADKKKPFRRHYSQGMGNFRYYLCQKGIIRPEELLEGWGLIYVHNDMLYEIVGQFENVKQFEFFNPSNVAEEWLLMYSLLRRKETP